MTSETAKDFIITESNQCVSCGLCLPHCPTYRLLKTEADSPRGRIALMNGVVRGNIPLNEKFIQHMDLCLSCRACEAVCPNHVSYGKLIDEAHALIADSPDSFVIEKKKFNPKKFFGKSFLMNPVRFDRMRSLLYFVQKTGLLRWLLTFNRFGKIGLFRFVAQLPRIKSPYRITASKKYSLLSDRWKEVYVAEGRVRGHVGLFLGCVARITDVATLNSSIFVLNRLGYTVHIPPQQTCCGAIYQHSGALEQAAGLMRQNKAVFSKLKITSIISTASGCGVQLLESGVANGDCQITDINQFLVTAEGWENIKIASLSQQVLVHDPCSLRNVISGHTYPYELIKRIPDVQVISLAGNDQCCGAAGTYFIEQPEIASMLLESKISAVKNHEARFLVTSNIGCAMHIANGLHEKGVGIEVLHPVTLLARQMGLEL